MGEKEFVSLCKREVAAYVRFTTGESIPEDEIYVVWLCKILQNNKALVSTIRPDGMYYELTFNGDTGHLYVDAYRKVDNCVVLV